MSHELSVLGFGGASVLPRQQQLVGGWLCTILYASEAGSVVCSVLGFLPRVKSNSHALAFHSTHPLFSLSVIRSCR